MESSLPIILGIIFLFCFLVGAPLFSIIGGAAVVCFSLIDHQSMAAVIIEMTRLANAPGITAVPLFIFAGYILAESKSADRIIRVSNAFVGWIPGGLVIVCVLVSTLFTAMSGASGVTIIACGGLLLPTLVKDGYSRNFAMGLITAAGSSGVLVAPSLPIIIYGMIGQVDITVLFEACAMPAFLIVACLSLTGVTYALWKKIPTHSFHFKTLFAALWETKWEIPLPFIVLIGIYGGFITVSEAAVSTVVYVLFSECLMYREIPMKHLLKILIDSIITTGSILMVLGAALGFTNFLVDREIPQLLLAKMQLAVHSHITFLLLVNAVLLFVGSIMEIFSAIVVVVPLIAPVAIAYGVDPVHLGVIFLANLELGYLTPPFGINLFISCLRFDAPIMKLYRQVLPFLAIMIMALLLITYWPRLTTWLVDVLGGRPALLPM